MKIISLAIVAALVLILLLHAPIVPVLVGSLFAATILTTQSRRSRSRLKSMPRDPSSI